VLILLIFAIFSVVALWAAIQFGGRSSPEQVGAGAASDSPALAHQQSPAQAQGFEFKGFVLGGTKEDFLALHAWKSYRCPDKPWDEVYRPNAVADQTYATRRTQDLQAYVLDGHVVCIEAELMPLWFDDIVRALLEKYGQPAEASITECGGRWCAWRNADGGVISFNEQHTPGRCLLQFSAPYVHERIRVRIAEREAGRVAKNMKDI